MKELFNHEFMDRRTVRAWETNSGEYVQVYDVRDLYYGEYSVEIEVLGGMKNIYIGTLEKCTDKAIKYANTH